MPGNKHNRLPKSKQINCEAKGMNEFSELKEAYSEFAEAMKETKLGSIIIAIIEFLDKCFDKI